MLDEQAPAPVNALYAYVGAFADELARAGARHVVVCPGSRSTPLALAFAAQPGLRVWMHVDERSAAFFALGLAKRLGAPVALLCTSGTAAANFYPAIVEAHLTHVPLLALTADRPPELREVGAPQAIDQNRLYGSHVKWYVDVALPEATNDALRAIRTLADRAVALTQAIPAGPVHLNFPFREPLTPDAGPLPALAERDAEAWGGRPDGAAYTRVSDAPLTAPHPATVGQLAEALKAAPRGLIVVGSLGLREGAALAIPALKLAHRLGYPILADPLSQFRGAPAVIDDHQLIMVSYDAYLRSEQFSAAFAPQVILRFGAMPTSKSLLQYLQRHPQARQIVVNGAGDWPEPTHLAAELIHADPATLCDTLADDIPQPDANGKRADAGADNWLGRWRLVEVATREALTRAIADFAQPFEGRVFGELASEGALVKNTTLCVGNSMPIRDLDTFFWGNAQVGRLIGNRGANGIDGVISTALGVSAAARTLGEQSAPGAPVAPDAADTLAKPGMAGGVLDGEAAPYDARNAKTPRERVVLVIGDLSFYHDMNGLLAARLHQLDLTIILVNNDGGGIFSFLPQADHPDHFETLFGTPTGLDMRLATRLYGGRFTRAANWGEFRAALTASQQAGGLAVIEVATQRDSNVTLHRQLWRVTERAIAEALGAPTGDEPSAQ